MVNTERLCMGCMNDNGGERICPICGHDSSLDNLAQYLSIGTWLNGNRYIVGKVIEENGDSVTYIAWDNDNNAIVNITEYLPVGISRRSADRLTVGPNENSGIAFVSGKDDFLALYTGLARLSVQGLLQVVDVFESNGTVYSVNNTVSSISLKDFLIRNGGVLKWEQTKPLFLPLLSTLSQLHNAGIVHGGISPETILVGRDGRLYLTGFSIKNARRANTEFAYKLSAGYSAPEQYDVESDFGAVSDIYAMGAVLFKCVIGSTPPDAKERLVNDRLSIPANTAETVSKGALAAIANALKIDAATRTPSAERLKKMLEAVVSATPAEAPQGAPEKKKSQGKKYAIISSSITAAFFIVVMVVLVLVLDIGKTPDKTPANSNQQSSFYELQPPQIDIKYNDSGIEVPDWTGKAYTEVITDLSDRNVQLEIIILGKRYSDEQPKGAIIEQMVKNTKVEPNSEIGVYLSLGSSTVTMPEVIGLTCEEAKLKLLEQGFLGENIEFRERLTDDTPGTVTACTVKANEKISVDSKVIIDYCPITEDSLSNP